MLPVQDQRPILKPRPVWTQIVTEARTLGKTQVFIPLGMAAATLAVNWWRGEPISLLSVGISIIVALFIYCIIAVVRAPFVVIGHQSQQIANLETSVSQLQQSASHNAPNITIRIKEYHIIPSFKSAECFVSIALINLTDIPCANLQDYVLTLTISGADYESDKLLVMEDYYLSTYKDTEIYGEVLYDEVQEVHIEEKETNREWAPDIRKRTEQLEKGMPLEGWLGFRVTGLPEWPYDEEVVGGHMEWTLGEDGEPLEEVPVDDIIQTIRIDPLHKITLKAVDWYNKPHYGQTTGPFNRYGRRIALRSAHPRKESV